MSLSSTSESLRSSTGTFNSNSSISSTVDRYAALKDLDEQLREIKDKDLFNSGTSIESSPTAAVTPTNANPFKISATPSQPQIVSNPFQSSPAQSSGIHPTWTSDFGGNNNGGTNFLSSNSTTQMYSNVVLGNGHHVGNGGGHIMGNGFHVNNGFGGQQQQSQPNPFSVIFIKFKLIELFLIFIVHFQASTLSSKNNPFL